ncbi:MULTISPECIES: DUF2256 domain-containing protein [Pseudomonas]|nr:MULTISPECIES: DUF2256 domain-containing protein [Pseudomonas]MBP2838906.1 DUF2256 domain-containing protein [Pseudomonas sp. PNP]MCE0860251.1 DUF2256 domain-containing protein [Pseudomonas alloputida]MCE0866089.1 DUF2256 domain-containing protein [Pseudomonas alloputida]MCE0889292.1 DUF2256 domain-containing protein [Pseudomonas alloputida]MCE0918503.1 DUF2256 domain-containing protein [Pseudomonas alloputida]
MKKSLLPSKVCVVCGRPFTWRKRWARCWEQVRYCSERCRRSAPRREARQQGQGQSP